MHDWTIWFPSAAATGLLVARARIDPTDVILLHAAPPTLTVDLHDAEGLRLARGDALERTQDSPICRLRRVGEHITREDIWPTEAEVGSVVILPGGEAGVLTAWWHADDQRSWRWSVEFFNELAG